MNTITPPLLPTTIGKESQFAIKVDLDDSFGDEWLFGRIGYVIDGNDVGDYGLGTSLRDVLLQMHFIMSDGGKRRTPGLLGKNKIDLFETVWCTLFGDETTGAEAQANDECWAKHDITIPVDVFDYVRVFQFDEGESSRIIWRSFGDDCKAIVNEIIVPSGTVESAFHELNRLLETLTEWEKCR